MKGGLVRFSSRDVRAFHESEIEIRKSRRNLVNLLRICRHPFWNSVQFTLLLFNSIQFILSFCAPPAVWRSSPLWSFLLLSDWSYVAVRSCQMSRYYSIVINFVLSRYRGILFMPLSRRPQDYFEIHQSATQQHAWHDYIQTISAQSSFNLLAFACVRSHWLIFRFFKDGHWVGILLRTR